MPNPAVSVIIPTRNRPADVRRCVDSVLAQTFADLEVVVLDDGSQPPLELALPRTTVLRQDVNVHACRARNLAAVVARGRYLVCLDDDTELTDPTALATAVAFADARPAAGVVAFCQTGVDGRPGLNPAPNDVPGPCWVGHFSGCGVLLRRDVFDRIGGFTELLGYYYEELEYSMRVFDAGSRVAYHPGVRIVHYHDATGRNWRRLHRLIARNALLTIVLRFPAWAVLPAAAAQQFKYLRDQLRDARLRDPAGPFHIWAGVAARLPAALAARRPVRWSALRQYKGDQRHPQPILPV
jgi:GT2 family glycosyltransferase